MKLLANGFTTAASTLAGSTGGGGGASSAGGSGPVGPGSFTIRRISFLIASSAAPNSSGGLLFRYGQSSGVDGTTLVLAGGMSSAGIAQTLDGFDIQCQWFEAESQEAGAGGVVVSVFGD